MLEVQDEIKRIDSLPIKELLEQAFVFAIELNVSSDPHSELIFKYMIQKINYELLSRGVINDKLNI